MNIIQRTARDSFDALKTADAMEKAGASVFSVTFDGMVEPDSDWRVAHPRFIVWAKFEAPVTYDSIDAAIEQEFEGVAALPDPHKEKQI